MRLVRTTGNWAALYFLLASFPCAVLLLMFLQVEIFFFTPHSRQHVACFAFPEPCSSLGAIHTFLAICQCIHRCFGKCFHSTHTTPVAVSPFLSASCPCF